MLPKGSLGAGAGRGTLEGCWGGPQEAEPGGPLGGRAGGALEAEPGGSRRLSLRAQASWALGCSPGSDRIRPTLICKSSPSKGSGVGKRENIKEQERA